MQARALAQRKSKEEKDIKKINSMKGRSRVRFELSSAVGLRNGGFYQGCAERLVNLRVKNGALCLRDGIIKGFSLPGEIIFAQSVVCNGSAIGFVSDENEMYAVYEESTNESPGEPVFYSGVRPESSFVFSVGNRIYLFSNGSFYEFDGVEFSEASFGRRVLYKASPRVEREELLSCVNMLSGSTEISFSFSDEVSSVSFGEEITSVLSAKAGEEDITATLGTGGREVTLSRSVRAGETLVLTVVPRSAEGIFDGTPSLIGCAMSDTGECMLYSGECIFRAEADGEGLFLSYPEFESSRNSIRACFYCSGRLAAAIGNTVGLIEDGRFTAIDSDGISGSDCVCTGGAYAYLNTGSHIIQLSFSPSGSSYDVNCTTLDNSFAKREAHVGVSMAYSHFDSSLYSICLSSPSSGARSLFSLDTQNGVWTEIEGIDSPKYCFALDRSVCVSAKNRVYFITEGRGSDRDADSVYPIEGRILTCASDFFSQADRKRVLSASASLGGLCESFTLTLIGDNGREDHFTYESPSYPAETTAFPVYRMNIGSFTFAKIEAKIKGYAGAAVHDVYIDLKGA